MSAQASVFDNGDYVVDVITKDGAPWFRAADLTRILGYSNGRQAVITHVRSKYSRTKEKLFYVELPPSEKQTPPVCFTDTPRLKASPSQSDFCNRVYLRGVKINVLQVKMADHIVICEKTGADYCTVSELYCCMNCAIPIGGSHMLVCKDCDDSYDYHVKKVVFRLGVGSSATRCGRARAGRACS